MRRPFRISSEAECPAARARFNARTSSSSSRTVVEISRAIHSPYNKVYRKAIRPVRPETKQQSGGSLFCRMKGAEARGHRTPDGFAVFLGSMAVLQERQSAKKWPYVIALREKLIADGTLVQKDGFYRFTKDVEFSSPSAAAAVIEGAARMD